MRAGDPTAKSWAVVYVAQSLDGYIADELGSVAWLEQIPNPNQSDFGFADFISQIDAILMGRKTYQQVLGFAKWPYEVPVFVVSSTLDSVPKELDGKVTILNNSPLELMRWMELRGHYRIYVDGGSLIQSFLKEDLIDALELTTVPVLLGGGTSLFGKLEASMDFEFAGVKEIGSGLMTASYKRCHKD